MKMEHPSTLQYILVKRNQAFQAPFLNKFTSNAGKSARSPGMSTSDSTLNAVMC